MKIISEIIQRKNNVDKTSINQFENEIDYIKKEKEELIESLSSMGKVDERLKKKKRKK